MRPSCRGYRVAIYVPWSRYMVQYMGYGQPKMKTLMFPRSRNVIPDSRWEAIRVLLIHLDPKRTMGITIVFG